MRPDDAYLSRLQYTITALRYWAPSIADTADIDESETADHWRLAVAPKLRAACPFELIIRADRNYDIGIAGQDYEARPVASLDLFAPLLEAITSGAVLQRRWFSTSTGLPRAIETVVILGDGRRWHGTDAGDADLTLTGAECTNHYFLPYRR